MANFTRAAPFQRLLFPDLAGIAFVGGALTYYNEMYASATTLLSISPGAFTGATAAISILAGFRLNASYGRYREGRQYWSMVNTAARDLARQSFLWIRSKDDALPLQQAQARMVRYTQAFPVALLFHVNDKGGHHNMTRKPYHTFDDRVLAEFQAELQDVYGCRNTDPSLDDALQKDLGQILHTKQQGGNAPLEIILGMSQILQICQRYDHIHPCYIREMEQQIQQFAKALGSCERIIKTPLPTGYSRHSSRLLFIWSHTLPLALYPLLGPWGTVPTSLLTAYAVLGIEDISIQFEDPFDILPLRQYSDAMFDSVKAIEEAFQRKRKEAH
jgi:putative membrane protein